MSWVKLILKHCYEPIANNTVNLKKNWQLPVYGEIIYNHLSYLNTDLVWRQRSLVSDAWYLSGVARLFRAKLFVYFLESKFMINWIGLFCLSRLRGLCKNPSMDLLTNQIAYNLCQTYVVLSPFIQIKIY